MLFGGCPCATLKSISSGECWENEVPSCTHICSYPSANISFCHLKLWRMMYIWDLYDAQRVSVKFFAAIFRNAISIASSCFHVDVSSHELNRLQTRWVILALGSAVSIKISFSPYDAVRMTANSTAHPPEPVQQITTWTMTSYISCFLLSECFWLTLA